VASRHGIGGPVSYVASCVPAADRAGDDAALPLREAEMHEIIPAGVCRRVCNKLALRAFDVDEIKANPAVRFEPSAGHGWHHRLPIHSMSHKTALERG
jgi:hypothetical protein